jgi:hypothetical protein
LRFNFSAFNTAPLLVPGRSGPIVTGDFDKDGLPDLAAVGSGGVVVYISKGDGTFASKDTLPASDIESMNVADFNGDGISDLAITEVVDKQTAVIVALGEGDGTFPHSTTLVPTSLSVSTVIADFNGDGVPDLAASNPSNHIVGT